MGWNGMTLGQIGDSNELHALGSSHENITKEGLDHLGDTHKINDLDWEGGTLWNQRTHCILFGV